MDTRKNWRLDRAKVMDAQAIQKLINRFASRDLMLSRSLSEIYDNIRDFFVIRNRSGRVVGACALHIAWQDLAEVKSLAVEQRLRGKGLGARLVSACLNEAEDLGVKKVFCLTKSVGFFKKMQFKIVSRNVLPHKIWGECVRCPHFPDCNETAMIYKSAKRGNQQA